MTEMKLYDLEIYKDCKIVANKEDDGFAIADLEPVDAVPVVRCKDCKFWKDVDIYGNSALYCCGVFNNDMFSEGFCCYGKRKEAPDGKTEEAL